MFRIETKKRTNLTATLELIAVTYHATVRAARGGGPNALFTLIMNVVQTAIFILALYLSMYLLGMRSSAFRGDFIVFLMSGVMSYTIYKNTMKAVFGADGPTSPMMLHAPMNSAVAIASAALSTLYEQALTSITIMGFYHLAIAHIEILHPAYAFFMMICAWTFGIGSGLVLLAIRPWVPKLAPVIMTIAMRVNIFASGKMMVANTLSFTLLKFFDWNPLFHIIDQMRGAIFINYSPRNTSIEYALWVTFGLFVVGLMGEFFTRQYVSSSWFKR